jgi:hypothetical protein
MVEIGYNSRSWDRRKKGWDRKGDRRKIRYGCRLVRPIPTEHRAGRCGGDRMFGSDKQDRLE